jgi:hypothetical protein
MSYLDLFGRVSGDIALDTNLDLLKAHRLLGGVGSGMCERDRRRSESLSPRNCFWPGYLLCDRSESLRC